MGSISIGFTDDTQQCVHVIYGDGWDWPEFFATDETAKEMLNGLDHKADFILELASAALPKNVVGQFPKFVRGAASLTHANSRRVVIVGASGPGVTYAVGRASSRSPAHASSNHRRHAAAERKAPRRRRQHVGDAFRDP